MDRPEDIRDRMLAARREYRDRARSLIENFARLSREERLRARRDLYEIAERARAPRSSPELPSILSVSIRDVFSGAFGVKPFREEFRELEAELAQLEKASLTSATTGQQQKRRAKWKPPNARDEKVAAVIRDGGPFKDQAAYCRALDRAGIEVRIDWIKQGCKRSYIEADKSHPTPDCPTDWRERIRKEKNRIKRRLPSPKAVRGQNRPHPPHPQIPA